MRITSRGRVTIPKVIREAAGLLAHIEIEFVMDDDVVWIVRADYATKPGRGRMLLAGLQGSLLGWAVRRQHPSVVAGED